MSNTSLNDVVITYDENINSENRLKNLIRSIESGCEGYNEIVIIGDKPEWLQGVIHIGFNGASGQDDLLKNQFRKLKAACISKRITDSFYWVDADDISIKFDARKATRISIPAGSVMEYRPKGKEKIAYEHTVKMMDRRGFSMKHNYFNKYPMSINKERLMNVIEDIHFETKYGYCIKTMYANFNRLPPTEKEIEILNLTEFTKPSTYEKIN